MQGIELSRRFYVEIVRPWLDGVAPGLQHSAALLGYGSELLGFDDETSRDHNWGPRVQLFVGAGDFDAHARRLVDAFGAVAPRQFLGEPIGYRSRPHPPPHDSQGIGAVEHGLELHTVEGMLERLLAVRSVDTISPLQWLGFAEQRLLAFTAGAVFHDGEAGLGRARQRLSYFPKDIWLFKIAAQWGRISQEQAFVGRAGQAGDDLGSRVIAARLVRDVMRMSFLLERRYAPYAKWLGSAFARLPLAVVLSPLLRRVLTARTWQRRSEALASSYLVLARRQLADGIGRAFVPVIGPYFERPFPTINADEAADAARGGIVDPAVRNLPVIGSVDQVTDLTPLLEDPHQTQRLMKAILG